MLPTVLVHIVTFNSADCVKICLDRLFVQDGYAAGQNLTVQVTDNASSDGTPELIHTHCGFKARIFKNTKNLGFAGAHNQGVKRFLDGEYQYLLILNPDVALDPGALAALVGALEASKEAGTACPRLLRAGGELKAVMPKRLDAAGMVLTPSLRHFDRGSEEEDRNQYQDQEFVFGGSGACLLLRRDFVMDVLLEGKRDADSAKIYPQLASGRAERKQLFDEAFFAFREDADLAWRAANLGWECLYVPKAAGTHRRSVLPEKRRSLPKELNRWSVRNRFLLQLNNYFFSCFKAAFLPGIVFRNLIVFLGVIFTEPSSIPAFVEVIKLLPRAKERRQIIYNRARERESLWVV